MDLKSEVDSIKYALNGGEVSLVSEKNLIFITINIRKCLVLRIVVDKTYPQTKPKSAKVYVSDTNNLKPERSKVINEFLDRANSILAGLIEETNSGSSVLGRFYENCTLMLVGEDYLKESFDVIESRSKTCSFKFDDEDDKKTSVLTTETVEKPKNQHKKQAGKKEDEDDSKKGQKFKGSDYIFQRIKWDDNVDKKQVVIGYLDRFLGIKDIKFDDFKGVHEDYKEGIPFHRIRYFKINDRIVWDREQKIDLLTGSGDAVADFFEKKHTTDMDEIVVDLKKDQQFSKETFVDGHVFKCSANKWNKAECDEKNFEFTSQFKLVTYNLMSKNNFKKSILSKMNFKKSQLEVMNRSIENEDEYGLKPLEKIDRMQVIIKSIEENSWDFLLLQECDEYEEMRLRENEFVQKNYFICSYDRKNAKIDHPNCVILSKAKPALFKLLKLTDNSNKYALIAKFNVATNSLRRFERVLFVNVHLSSNKAKNFNEKRKIQLETLKRYLVDQIDEFDLEADHYFLCGDFNFGDLAENQEECALMRELFEKNGFADLVRNANTFEPNRNFSAAVTAFNPQGRRLDRILYRSESSNLIELIDSYLVNTAPFKIDIDPVNPVLYQPYLSVASYTKQNRIKIDLSENADKTTIPYECSVSNHEYLLHPSDHYAIECLFKFRKSTLHESNVVHKSTLAVIAPSHTAEDFIQAVRKDYDPQFNRWPPHINLLYPFFEDISLDTSEDTRASVVGDIFSCLSRFKPFQCDLEHLNTFDNNGVVFLEPSKDAEKQMKMIYSELVRLFSRTNLPKKGGSLTPHMTIAQPVDKRKVDKKWARETLEAIKDKFKPSSPVIASFPVDCIYWIRRTETSPFRVEQAFPLGVRYPPIITGLNLTKSGDGLLKFMHDRELIMSKESDENFRRVCDEILISIANAISKSKSIQFSSNNNQVSYESTTSSYLGLLTCGSYMHGVKCSDLDLAIVRNATDQQPKEEFASSLAYDLSQNDQLFHIVRNIGDANVPIIELCLKSSNVNGCESADVQIHEIDFERLEEANFFDNYELMKKLDPNDYSKLFPISGLFENQNIKKYIRNYKDFQIVVSFVKYWAKTRCIYGKAFGYIGGISWSILVAYYLQKNASRHELAIKNDDERFVALIRGFFKFYSSFNWSSHPISLVDVEFVARETRRYQHGAAPMMIHQTVYPYHNTSKNVNEKSRRIIKNEIQRASDLMNQSGANFYQVAEMVCKKVEKSDLPENRIGFRITYTSRDDLNHVFVLIKAKTQGLITSLLRINGKTDFRAFTSLFDDESSDKSCCYFYIGIYDSAYFNSSEKQLLHDLCNNFISSVKSLTYCSNYDIVLEYQ